MRYRPAVLIYPFQQGFIALCLLQGFLVGQVFVHLLSAYSRQEMLVGSNLWIAVTSWSLFSTVGLIAGAVLDRKVSDSGKRVIFLSGIGAILMSSLLAYAILGSAVDAAN